MAHRNFKVVPNLLFGSGCISQLGDILNKLPNRNKGIVFIVDQSQKETSAKNLPIEKTDLLIFADTSNEPSTVYVDQLTEQVKAHFPALPACVIGMGGGASMDLGKSVSLMLTNDGGSAKYQGWDLIQNPAVYHIGIPTLSGSGAEVSRTAVLLGPEKKLGLNSDYTVFDQIILDPELISSVPKNQWFYTGMDCYIHCVESLDGKLNNEFSRSYGEKSLDLCKEVFVDNHPDKNEKLMIASYMGGMSIAYSQVGACHALSYGLSFVLHTPHGLGNCIAFDVLDDIYPEGVETFRGMVDHHKIDIPKGIAKSLTEEQMQVMVKTARALPPLWQNVYGDDWESVVTEDFVRGYYEKM
jgi:3-deoxy-alpha-D-manno-octulosonate 8-oxidase